MLVAGALMGAVALVSAAPASAAPSSPALAHATRVGGAPGGQPLELILPLKVDAVGLGRFATAVSTPGSSFYGRYLSVAALAKRFGASPSVRARAVGYLRASGATHVRVDATGLLAEATMNVRLAERAFAAPIASFRAAHSVRFVAPTTPTTLPAPLRGVVEGVVGLDTRPQASPTHASVTSAAARSAAVTATSAEDPGSTLPRSGTPAGCPDGMAAGGQYPGFTPNQYLTAYDFPPLYSSGFQGQGERVALIEIDGFNLTDVQAFAQCFGLTLPPVSAFGAGLSNSLPPGEEATLDLEVLDAAAPGLKAIDVYETDSTATHTLAAFAAPLENRGRKPQVISASLGLCERDAFGGAGLTGLEAAERLLELAAASGVSVLASSGDNGSADCQTGPSGPPEHKLAVNYPASSWWVTGVGGTNLSLTPGNTIAAQPVWNDGTLIPAGGGGGFSDLFGRPGYQKGTVAANRRAVPDVSMLADLLPGYAIYCTADPDCTSAQNPSPPWQTVGGTSAGTPLLAGGVAIIDQMLTATHHENLGLLNPLLYQLGRSATAGIFYDVTTGSNDIGAFIGNRTPLGCCSAGAGFDEASGWGSVDVASLSRAALALVPAQISFALSLPKRQRPVAHREILATVSCSSGCAIGAFAQVKVGRARPFTVYSPLTHRRAKGRSTLAVKFSKKQLRTLRSALSSHKKIVATVFGALIDQLGDIEHNTRGEKLRIRS